MSRVFVDNFVSKFAVPLRIHSDQGHNFELTFQGRKLGRNTMKINGNVVWDDEKFGSKLQSDMI